MIHCRAFEITLIIAAVLGHRLLSQEGSHWLLAFYGFGQEANAYEKLQDCLGTKANVLVLDLPDNILKPEDLFDQVEVLMLQFDIQEFSTISYSFGARLNLLLFGYMPERIDKMFLCAPDSFQREGWFELATRTLLGRWFFEKMCFNASFYQLIKFLVSPFLPRRLKVFAAWNMRNPEDRAKVYKHWTAMRFMKPNLNELKAAERLNQTKIYSYFGQDDQVIPVRLFKRCQKTFPKGQHNLLEADHFLFNTDLFEQIAGEF